MVMTYLSIDEDGSITRGGYSNEMVVNEHFAIRWPENLPLDGGAPLLCAGCSVYSPLMYYGLSKPGTHLGIVGLGGLGHAGVKFAKAMGLKVTVISTTPGKKEEAINRLGADSFLVSTDPEQMQVNLNATFIISNFQCKLQTPQKKRGVFCRKFPKISCTILPFSC